MIVLDTDVLSAAIRQVPERTIVDWFDRQPAGSLCITTITLFEIRSGIEQTGDRAKRHSLAAAFELALRELLEGRVLPFDEPAARVAADLFGVRRRGGITIGAADTQIAGIAVSRGHALATRNVRHFPNLPVPVINPWEA
jgi:predicted nucleic acid-binding protein